MDHLFAFQVSPAELIVRGSLLYWFLFLLFRFVLRRDSGSIGLADILVVVLIADAAQNGMAGEYKTVSEGCLLIGTIAAWNLFIDWLAYRSPAFARFAAPPVVPLIRAGVVLGGNLNRQMITEDELASQLRRNGVRDAAEVAQADLEPDGSISVIRRSGDEAGPAPKKHTPGAA